MIGRKRGRTLACVRPIFSSLISHAACDLVTDALDSQVLFSDAAWPVAHPTNIHARRRQDDSRSRRWMNGSGQIPGGPESNQTWKAPPPRLHHAAPPVPLLHPLEHPLGGEHELLCGGINRAPELLCGAGAGAGGDRWGAFLGGEIGRNGIN